MKTSSEMQHWSVAAKQLGYATEWHRPQIDRMNIRTKKTNLIGDTLPDMGRYRLGHSQAVSEERNGRHQHADHRLGCIELHAYVCPLRMMT